jgi:hypothetical protein
MLYYCPTITSAQSPFPLDLLTIPAWPIYNIFILTAKFEKFTVSPLINDLSDHNAEIIAVHMPHGPFHDHSNRYTSNINKHTIAQFQYN